MCGKRAVESSFACACEIDIESDSESDSGRPEIRDLLLSERPAMDAECEEVTR